MSALTISETNVTADVTTNTRSSVLRLNNGKNRLWVESASWSGGKAAALKYARIPDTDSLGSIKDADGAISITENDGVDIEGPGFVCFDLTNSDAVAVRMGVLQCAIM